MSVAKIDNVGGGVKLTDINPEKNLSANFAIWQPLDNTAYDRNNSIPINGYKKISIYMNGTSANYSVKKYSFVLENGTETTKSDIPTTDAWTDYIDIPDDAIIFKVTYHYSYSTTGFIFYSLLA